MDISIIVPLFNGKKYINNIIHMIEENKKILEENQIKKDIEVIFIQDDPDEEIDKIYLCNFSVFFHKNAQNLGIHESRLIGLSKSKGDYIVFLDQDDEINSCYLLRQISYIKKADAVICNGIYRNNKIIYETLEQQKRAVSKNYYLKDNYFIVSPGQIMIKKESVPEKWGKTVMKKNGSDDVLLWILMLCESKKFSLNPYCDYIHKENGENMSLNFSKMMYSIDELLIILRSEDFQGEEEIGIFENALIEKFDKYKKYAELQRNWKTIVKKIVDLVKEDEDKKIAIYGYGLFGKKLKLDLEYEGIEPSFFIDRAYLSFQGSDCIVYGPENILETADIIILTPLYEEKQIRDDLKKYNTKIISLNDLF